MKKLEFDISVSVPTRSDIKGSSLNKAVYDALAVVSRVNLNMLADAATSGKPVVIPASGAGKVGGVVRAGLVDVDVCGNAPAMLRPGRTGKRLSGDEYGYEFAYCSVCGHMQRAG